ncbi:MAG: NADP-dependent oxidoreductase [Alphaproteobacteria bacterium]|nr:NADP-dependent oxidoreductase [Alphaproteobacteria bacterium]
MTNSNDETAKEIILAARPDGAPKASDFELRQVAMPEAGHGRVLVRVLYLSLDPYMRGRMSDAKSYAPPVEIGAAMGGGAVGEVVRSSSKRFAPGDIVTGDMGWRSHAAVPAGLLRKVDETLGPISYAVSLLGMPGMTAYFGLLEVGRPKPGDTVLVSAASGAVGARVGQRARIAGCRVVGTVGSAEKAAYCREELGFDEVIDYRACDDLDAALAAACPNGIDVYFENVGGPTGDAAMRHLAFRARVVICGFIAEYNMTEAYMGPSHLRAILVSRASVHGFLVTDWLDRWPEGIARMAAWLKAGQLTFKEDVVDGLAAAPAGLIGLLEGRNFGKALVKVAER